MDEIFFEHAEALEAAEREGAIALARKKAFPDKLLTPAQYTSFDCQDCGEELTEFRMQRGCIRCVLCQTRFEKYKGP